MKNFLKENWFKLMTGTSMLIFSFAFLLYAVSPSYANYTKEETPSKSDYALVPLNKDGSINIKISEEQMSEMTATQDINIAAINGRHDCFYQNWEGKWIHIGVNNRVE